MSPPPRSSLHVDSNVSHYRHLADSPCDSPPPRVAEILSEARGPALKDAESSLAYIRGVETLARCYCVEPTMTAIEKAIGDSNPKKRCYTAFEGVETVLFDDGIEGHLVDWKDHHPYLNSKPKRLIRIEHLAEKVAFSPEILEKKDHDLFKTFVSSFKTALKDGLYNEDVAGFKSIICYRGGLGWNHKDGNLTENPVQRDMFHGWIRKGTEGSRTIRLGEEHHDLACTLVQIACDLMVEYGLYKPFQFHTGFGDEDLEISKATPV